MPGCCAPNCTNRNDNYRMFRFPRKPARRSQWVINCGRSRWTEWIDNGRLCEAHFEPSQFENKRLDGWRKLKPNAVPTIFGMPGEASSSMASKRKEIVKPVPPVVTQLPVIIGVQASHPWGLLVEDNNEPEDVSTLQSNDNHETEASCERESLLVQKSKLEHEIQYLKHELAKKTKRLSFLSEEQQLNAGLPNNTGHNWSDKGIVQGLKLRQALGRRGYKHMIALGYPTPSMRTLNRRLRLMKERHSDLLSSLPPLASFSINDDDIEDEIKDARKCCVFSMGDMEFAAVFMKETSNHND